MDRVKGVWCAVEGIWYKGKNSRPSLLHSRRLRRAGFLWVAAFGDVSTDRSDRDTPASFYLWLLKSDLT